MAIAKRKKNKPKQKTPRSGKDRTPIGRHRQTGGQLVPPLLAIEPRLQLTSWMDNRLPEMLWAALISTSFDRDYSLEEFRRILGFIGKHEQKEKLHDLTLTGIGQLEEKLRSEIIGCIVESPEVSDTLSVLRLFEDLPGKGEWHQYLPLSQTKDVGIESLMRSVGATLWHKSQEATDCRWVRVMAWIMAGKLFLPSEEMAGELFHYPNKFDQAKVRPTIRAVELTFEGDKPPNLTWPKAFWHEMWTITPCIKSSQRYKQPDFDNIVTRQSVVELRERLENHWKQTHSTTEINPKHDAVFGMALYALRILEEMMGIGIGTSILALLGLRTILEVRINLKYLLDADTPELWGSWRKYGAGQAKLNALKFDEVMDLPKYVDIESIEGIASEDVQEEFLTINLGSWSRLDLRRISEQANLKETYDQYYSWTSGYAHGMWGAVRESCYQTCGNPLHRLHRYPQRRPLQDAVDDATMLVDEILQHLDNAYPRFEWRLMAEDKAKPN